MGFFTGDGWQKYAPGCRDWKDAGSLGVQLVVGVMSDNRRNFYVQCIGCARLGSAVGKAALTPKEQAGAEVRLINLGQNREEIDRTYAERRLDAEQKRKQEAEEWWLRYDEYRATDPWRLKSRTVLLRDEYKCRAALPVCTGRATEAHHSTYRHLFHEPLFDLFAVCRECHHEITQLERHGIPREYRERWEA